MRQLYEEIVKTRHEVSGLLKAESPRLITPFGFLMSDLMISDFGICLVLVFWFLVLYMFLARLFRTGRQRSQRSSGAKEHTIGEKRQAIAIKLSPLTFLLSPTKVSSFLILQTAS